MVDNKTRQHDHLDYHIEVAGNFQKVCENLLTYIKHYDIKKEQIVSISTHETSTENGDSSLLLVTKRHVEPTMTSLEDLKFDVIRNTEPWDN
jgi:hypothetical protein